MVIKIESKQVQLASVIAVEGNLAIGIGKAIRQPILKCLTQAAVQSF